MFVRWFHVLISHFAANYRHIEKPMKLQAVSTIWTTFPFSYTHTHTRAHAHTHTHTHARVCVYIYIYICVCIYTYIGMPSPAAIVNKSSIIASRKYYVFLLNVLWNARCVSHMLLICNQRSTIVLLLRSICF